MVSIFVSQTVRELLTELAWIEDSIRHVPLTGKAGETTADAFSPSSPLNPDLVTLAGRERQISQNYASTVRPGPDPTSPQA